MEMKNIVLTGMVSFVIAAPAQAGFIVQADSVISSTAATDLYLASQINDQSGLSATYTSGVDDFDTFIASNPVHDNLAENVWSTSVYTVNSSLDFSFDQSYSFESMALWNRGTQQYGQAFNNQIGSFQLFSSSDASFSNLTLVGEYTAAANLGIITAVEAEVFNFNPFETAYLRMVITDPQPGGILVSASELAFEATAVSSVPVPASIWLMGSGLLGLVGLMRRKTK